MASKYNEIRLSTKHQCVFIGDLSYGKVREYGQITRTDTALRCMTELVQVCTPYYTVSVESIQTYNMYYIIVYIYREVIAL